MKSLKELGPKRHLVVIIFLTCAHAYCQDMRITTTSNFGDIELGLRSSVLVTIENVRSTGLTISSASVTTATTDGSPSNQWDCDCITPVSIDPGHKTYFKITFAPYILGTVSAQLLLGSADATVPGSPIFVGNGVASMAINSILVIDRSLSMGGEVYKWIDNSGTTPTVRIKQKIELARSGGETFYNLVKSRPGDRLGVVKFNSSNADEPVILGTPAPSLPSVLNGSGPTSAIDDSYRLKPQYGTDLNKGLQKALQRYSSWSAPISSSNIVVLISDGIQSNGCWTNVMSSIDNMRNDGCGNSSNCLFNKNIKVYSVAIGRDADQQKLRQISLASGVQDGYGYYYIDSESSGNSINGFFYKIWAHAKGYSTVRDPDINVSLKADKPIEIQSVSLTSSDIAASFFVTADSAYSQYYSLELRNPRGEVFKGTTKEGENQSSEQVGSNSVIYHLLRQKGNDDSFVGTWKLYLIPNGRCGSSPTSKEERGLSCTVPITFAAATKSDLRLEASVLASKNEPGAEISLMALATEENLPLANATVMVIVKSPDGRVTGPIELSNKSEEQAKSGDRLMKAKFYSTAAQGTYQFTFNAMIKNSKGESCTREEIRFFPLAYQIPSSGNVTAEQSGEAGYPSGLVWILVALVGVGVFVAWKFNQHDK